jgi:hypothetical protein
MATCQKDCMQPQRHVGATAEISTGSGLHLFDTLVSQLLLHAHHGVTDHRHGSLLPCPRPTAPSFAAPGCHPLLRQVRGQPCCDETWNLP